MGFLKKCFWEFQKMTFNAVGWTEVTRNVIIQICGQYNLCVHFIDYSILNKNFELHTCNMTLQ